MGKPPEGGEPVTLYSFNNKSKITIKKYKCKVYVLCKISTRNGLSLVLTGHEETDAGYFTLYHIAKDTHTQTMKKVEDILHSPFVSACLLPDETSVLFRPIKCTPLTVKLNPIFP
jgi:hypothetical protein